MSPELRRRETISGYLFLLPSLVFFLGFVVIPMVMCIITSFTDATMNSNQPDVFIGLTDECATRFQNIISSENYASPEIEYIDSVMLANERSAFFLEHDTTEISEPIECNAGMGEDLVAVCGEGGYDVLNIQINSPDDALDFADNAHMATLPVMFSGDDEIAMKLAVMLYQGRALIDGTSLIDPEELKNTARKYGAVIY